MKSNHCSFSDLGCTAGHMTANTASASNGSTHRALPVKGYAQEVAR
jgi:hypothetical protein